MPQEIVYFEKVKDFDFIGSHVPHIIAAAVHGDLHTVQGLIANGVSPFTVTNLGYGLLHIAAMTGNVPLTEYLLEQGLASQINVSAHSVEPKHESAN